MPTIANGTSATKLRSGQKHLAELRRLVARCERETGMTSAQARRKLHAGKLEETQAVLDWMEADLVLRWLNTTG